MSTPAKIREDALKAIEAKTLETIDGGISTELDEETQSQRGQDSNEALIILRQLEKIRSRASWNRLLKILVVCGFVSSYVVIILIGLHILDFGQNAFAVPSVVAVGIVQTYGLAKLAVQYFFSDDKK
jgi:hypothetical protein